MQFATYITYAIAVHYSNKDALMQYTTLHRLHECSTLLLQGCISAVHYFTLLTWMQYITYKDALM